MVATHFSRARHRLKVVFAGLPGPACYERGESASARTAELDTLLTPSSAPILQLERNNSLRERSAAERAGTLPTQPTNLVDLASQNVETKLSV